jgi:hypothetical protein
MSVIIPFQPTATQPFAFSPTIDGVVYSATVTWNVFRQGWYLNLFTQSGTLIVSRAMVGSPPGYDIDLIANLGFTNTLVFRVAANQLEIGP